MKDHHWIKMGTIDVLVKDDGNRPVLVFYQADLEEVPRPPEIDVAAIAEETGWGVAIERLWVGCKTGFVWRVKCRATLRTGFSNRELRDVPQEHYNDRHDRNVTSLICEASGLHASSSTMQLTGDWEGFKRGAYLVWTYANGTGCLAVGECPTADSLIWALLSDLEGAPWTPRVSS